MTGNWPLGIADRYQLFMDRRMRAEGGPGNGSVFLFELDGELDPTLLRARLDRLLDICPVLGAGLSPWPRRRWETVTGFRIPLEVMEFDGTADELFNRVYSRPFAAAQDPSFQAIVCPGATRSMLVLRWLHPLMDAPGGAMVVRLLAGEDVARYRLHDEPPSLARRSRGGSLARLAVAVHNFMLRHAAASLPPAIQPKLTRSTATPELLAVTFDREETAAIDARAAELAGSLESNHYFLAVAFRAAAQVLDAGRWSRLLIPCPINLRPPAWKGPVFSNYLSSVLVRLPASRMLTLESTVTAVKRRFRRSLRRREDAAAFWMMGLVRFLPHPLYTLLMLGPMLRDPASLYYSHVSLNVGEDGTLFGMPIRRCLAASHVLRPPAAALVFVRCAGKLTVQVPQRGYERAQDLLDRAVALLRGED